MAGDNGQRGTFTANSAEAEPLDAPWTDDPAVQDVAPQAMPMPRSTANEALRLGSSHYGYTFRRALLFADLLGIAAAIAVADGILALGGRGGFSSGPLLILVAFVSVWVVLAQATNLYHLPGRRVDYTFADECGPLFLVTTVWIWLYAIVAAALLPGAIGLLGPTIVWLAAIVGILIARAIARRIARNRPWYLKPVLLVGDREDTDQVLSRLLRHPEWGLRAVHRARVAGDRIELESLEGADVSYVGAIQLSQRERFADRIVAVASDLEVDRVLLTGGSSGLAERTRLARLLTERGCCVDYVCGEPETLYAAAVLHHLEGLPVLSAQPTQLPRSSMAMKRGLDLAVSFAGLVLVAPVFAVVAILIKLDSRGPVFFRQARAGRDGTEFEAVKFRTMVDGADSMRADVRQQSIHANGNGLLKLQNDPRITRFGSKLRRWSIDELPQLWNVLLGDMSLVGPRPLPLDEAPLVSGHFELRSQVRPGMTGTWQTHGRSDIPFEDMIKLDYTYVAGWSLREDLRLLLRTTATVVHGRGTY
jgi:exopolysaccharide biosynthesis polyprenyl glycosylphosphotransferase